MSPPRRQHPKDRQQDPLFEDLQVNDPSIQKQHQINSEDVCSKLQTVEISSAQAQLYFQYLRKKISHQTNDPFSLPFLNLKFQQLDSWKGATQQLNLESKIYGMRVDNCHDNAVKMLNYVIRNQQDQIGKDTGAAEKQANKEDQIHVNHHHKSSHNFYLQKPEKINGIIETAIQLQNVSFWRTVFKKSQCLSQIQLNTIELSMSLSLQIDLKKVNFGLGQIGSDEARKQLDLQTNESFKYVFCDFNEDLSIFKEMEVIKREVSQEMDEILERRKKENKKRGENSIENPLWEMNLGIREMDFSEMYEDFNQFEQNLEDGRAVNEQQLFKPKFWQEANQNILPNILELRSISIEPINENSLEYEQQNDQDHFLTDLYQPQNDILFNSTYKKLKRPPTQIKPKIKPSHNSIIDFSTTVPPIDRKKAFKKFNHKKTHLQKHNLVPISYVLIYENRNPFKKLKKVNKNHTKTNIYDSNNNYQYSETQQVSKPFDSIALNLISQGQTVINFYEDNNSQENDEENDQTPKYMKHIPIKAVKQEIINEIKKLDRSLMLSGPTSMNNRSESQNLNRASYMDTYLQQEASMIGLKFFRDKMKTFDPLDLLVSLLHVAFQEQVILHPVYSAQGQTDTGDDLILKDILIQSEQCFELQNWEM